MASINERVISESEMADEIAKGYDPSNCGHHVEERNLPLQRNALRVEVNIPAARCIQKLPEHWNEGAKKAGGLRWLGSGGSPLVFGICDINDCPRAKGYK